METAVTEAEATAAIPFHQSLPTIVPVQVLDDERLTLIELFYVVVEASNGSFAWSSSFELGDLRYAATKRATSTGRSTAKLFRCNRMRSIS